MAGHDSLGGSEKKSSDATSDIPTCNAENLQSNMKIIYSRTFMSIIGGIIAGLLGFTGLMGFVVYLLVMVITSVGLTAKAGFSVHSYLTTGTGFCLMGSRRAYVICAVLDVSFLLLVFVFPFLIQ